MIDVPIRHGEPRCPHCDYAVRDAWEINNGAEGGAEHECGGCERPFYVYRHLIVSYTTSPIAAKGTGA